MPCTVNLMTVIVHVEETVFFLGRDELSAITIIVKP